MIPFCCDLVVRQDERRLPRHQPNANRVADTGIRQVNGHTGGAWSNLDVQKTRLLRPFR